MKPHYRSYTMEQLLDAQHSIDAATYPENAARLQAEIKRRAAGGEIDSDPPANNQSPTRRRIRFPSIPFIDRLPARDRIAIVFFLLVAMLGYFLALNLCVLIVSDNVLPTLPIFIQSTVLTFVLFRIRGAAWVVRIWASLLVVTGVFYWISVVSDFLAWAIYPESGSFSQEVTKFTIDSAVTRTVPLVMGIVFIVRATEIMAFRRKPSRAV
jgi:hypothetical protein